MCCGDIRPAPVEGERITRRAPGVGRSGGQSCQARGDGDGQKRHRKVSSTVCPAAGVHGAGTSQRASQ
eukprot:1547469-Prymnesium_polylepis.1